MLHYPSRLFRHDQYEISLLALNPMGLEIVLFRRDGFSLSHQ
ncbi:MAG: hypothetical protein QE493_08285 [Verrucomicrobiae bacterium]|nr:hypothetical protein [Verrucomicrobiae bacterium]